MKKIIVFYNILRNYKKFTKKFTLRFYLFINPFYCALCYILIKILLITKNFRLINFFCEKNLLQASLRYLSQKNREEVGENINYYYNKNLKALDTKYNDEILTKLKEDGFSKIGKIFTDQDCEDFKNILNGADCYNSQTLIQSDGKKIKFEKNFFEENVDYSYLYFPPNISLKMEKLNNFLTSESLINLIQNYLHFKPIIYNLTTWVNFQSKERHYVHRVHRDYDDFKFMTLIIYWTDADKNNGVTELIKGSHSSKKSSYDSSDLIALNSTKGTVFLFDGTTLHKGNEKINKYRIATFVRFGKRENYASVLDGGISDPLYYNS